MREALKICRIVQLILVKCCLFSFFDLNILYLLLLVKKSWQPWLCPWIRNGLKWVELSKSSKSEHLFQRIMQTSCRCSFQMFNNFQMEKSDQKLYNILPHHWCIMWSILYNCTMCPSNVTTIQRQIIEETICEWIMCLCNFQLWSTSARRSRQKQLVRVFLANSSQRSGRYWTPPRTNVSGLAKK